MIKIEITEEEFEAISESSKLQGNGVAKFSSPPRVTVEEIIEFDEDPEDIVFDENTDISSLPTGNVVVTNKYVKLDNQIVAKKLGDNYYKYINE